MTERTCFEGFHEDGFSGHAGHGQRGRHRRAHRRKIGVEAPQVHSLDPQIRLRAASPLRPQETHHTQLGKRTKTPAVQISPAFWIDACPAVFMGRDRKKTQLHCGLNRVCDLQVRLAFIADTDCCVHILILTASFQAGFVQRDIRTRAAPARSCWRRTGRGTP